MRTGKRNILGKSVSSVAIHIIGMTTLLTKAFAQMDRTYSCVMGLATISKISEVYSEVSIAFREKRPEVRIMHINKAKALFECVRFNIRVLYESKRLSDETIARLTRLSKEIIEQMENWRMYTEKKLKEQTIT